MPNENWFQYVRRIYMTAINFPCITPLIPVRSINIREILQVYAIRLKRSRDSLCLSLFISFVCPCPPLVLQYFCPVLCLSVPRSYVCPVLRLSMSYVCLSYTYSFLRLSNLTFVLFYVCPVQRLACSTFALHTFVFPSTSL